MSEGDANNDPAIGVRLTGEISVVVDGQTAPLRGAKQLALLARLALGAGSTVTRERLLDDLWAGQRLESGSGALRVQVNRLRKALETVGLSDVVLTEPDGYQLDVPKTAVDIYQAEALTTEAMALADEPAAAVKQFEAASAVLSGEPLPGLEDFPFAREAAAQFAVLAATAHRQWALAMIASGDPASAIGLLTDQLVLDPLDSHTVVELMRAYRSTGRPHVALQIAGRHRQELRDAGLSPTDAVVEEERQALGGDDTPTERPALVGREAECAQLGAAIEELDGGRGGVVMLTGSPGMGKTALLEWTVERFGHRDDIVVYRGAGDRLEADLPLQVVRELFSSMPEVTSAIDSALSEMAAQSSAGSMSQGESSPDWARIAASNELVDVLRLAFSSPVLLLVDDVHWADDSSLHVLRRLARLSQEAPILLVAAGRAKGHDDWREQLTVGRPATHTLSSLPQSASMMLAGAILEESIDPLAERAIEQTGGLPLLVVELARALRSGTQLIEVDGRVVLEGVETPDSFVGLVQSRLDDLSPELVETCQAIAVLGRHATMERVASLLERRPLEVVRLVQEATNRGVLGVTGSRIEFQHDVIREAVDVGLSSASRPIFHRRAADILSGDGAPVTSVAAHAAIAAAGPGDDEVVRWLREAADQTSALEPSTALVFLDRALAIATTMDARFEIQRAKVEALASAGRITEGIELLKTLSFVEPARMPELSIRLAGLQMLANDAAEARKTIEAALSAKPSAPVRARLLAVSSMVSMAFLECEIASDDALSAVELGTQVGDLTARSIACGMLGRLRSFDYQTQEGLRFSRMAVEFAEADATGEAHTYQPWSVLAMSALDMDAHDEVELATEQGIRRARDFYAPWSEPIYQALRASLAYRRGQLDDVVSISEQILANQSDVGHGPVDPWAHAFLSLVASRRGDQERAAQHATAAVETEARTSNPLGGDFVMMARAFADASAGEIDAAIDHLRAGWDLFDAINVRTCLPVLAPALARLAIAGGRRDAVAGIVEECVRVAEATGVRSYQALAARVRGLIDGDVEAMTAACRLYEETERTLDLRDAKAELAALEAGSQVSATLH